MWWARMCRGITGELCWKSFCREMSWLCAERAPGRGSCSSFLLLIAVCVVVGCLLWFFWLFILYWFFIAMVHKWEGPDTFKGGEEGGDSHAWARLLGDREVEQMVCGFTFYSDALTKYSIIYLFFCCVFFLLLLSEDELWKFFLQSGNRAKSV